MIEAIVEPTTLQVNRVDEMVLELSNLGDGTCFQIVFSLELPETFVPLSGGDRLEISALEPGEQRHLRVRVRPREEGEWELTSRNFAYRDSSGVLHRIHDFRQAVVVRPARPEVVEPAPEMKLSLHTQELPLGEWSTLRARLTHLGGDALQRVDFRIRGQVQSEAHGAWQAVQWNEDASAVDLEVQARGNEAGETVPVVLEARFTDRSGRKGSLVDRGTLRVRARPASEPRIERDEVEVTTILMFCSNPVGTSRVSVDAEARDLKDEIRRSEHRDRLKLEVQTATRPEDVLRWVLELKPRILHFSGHGDSSGSLVMEDALGGVALVSSVALTGLASLLEGTLECAVLNACFSAVQAREMVAHIPWVIGMSREIEDRHAREFTYGFYMALGAGEPIDRAFRYGCQMIAMKSGRGQDVPLLLRRGGEAPGTRESA